jgi:hypothetical protein
MSVFRDIADELKRAGMLNLAKIHEDFENGVGTYLKVVRFSEPTNPDGFVVLYLRSNGTFLLLGYWKGYEPSVVAGRWSREGDTIQVRGVGNRSTCTPPDAQGQYQRQVDVQMENDTPILVASTDLTGWSLLGWKGPFAYVGRETLVDPDGMWLPKSSDEVDAWINRLST